MTDETTTNYAIHPPMQQVKRTNPPRNIEDYEACHPRCYWCTGHCVLIQHVGMHGQSVDCRCDRHAIPSHRIGG
jgi:hypothetical protein